MQLAIIVTQKVTSRHFHFSMCSKCSAAQTQAVDVDTICFFYLPTARSATAWLKHPTRCWCIISVCLLTILK